ncbi:capsule assembly Wzi family protein [Salinimicrobium sp. GXAS 041]|uniref:capsule assembly Wzi family protein n=1 Tax=Salinimicrobium sp. GXAS 041 TaxID=3400806 RepID=UPI003C722C63
MNLKYLPLLLISIFFSTGMCAQLTESEEELLAPSLGYPSGLGYSLELNVKGLAATGKKLPFWLHNNQRGRVSKDSNISSWVSAKKALFLSDNSYLIFGAGALFQDGAGEGLVIDELYGHFQNSWMYATLGRKQRPEVYNGISSSNASLLWSLNTRPMPGIQLGTTRPVFLFGEQGIGFEGSWNEYLLGNNRVVEGARLHHKNIRFVVRVGTWQMKAGIQHFVQWAGESPRYGVQPDSFQDYLTIITGGAGGEDAVIGDQQNALGNTVGGYEFYLSKAFRDFKLEFFYNHLFEDGTGTRFVNKPDGRYGLYYEDEDKFLNSFIYEFTYTENQSYKTLGVHKYDNYFNNGIYASGWTYNGKTIGSPFFIPNENGIGIRNNKFTAHHIGIGGQISNYFNIYPYKLLLSYSRNDGRYHDRFRPKQDVFYGFLDVRLLQMTFDVNLQLGIEYNSFTSPSYGGGVHVVYKL